MNRKELSAALAKNMNISEAEAYRNIGEIINIIGTSLKKGNSIMLAGFGTFSVTKRSARAGRNPATGASIKIKAKKVPKFKAGKTLKEMVS